jgi:hypothetical protein
MRHDIAVLVVSCDAYSDLWGPFFSLFFKYWRDCPWPIYLGTNHLASPDTRVTTVAIGDDKDYSSNLLAMLDRVDAERVLVWLEDLPLRAPVHTDRLLGLAALAKARDLGYVKLVDILPYAGDETALGVGPLPPQRYRVSMTVALWKTAVLRRLLVPGESAWAFEKNGSGRSTAIAEAFYAPSYRARTDPPLRHVHLVVRGAIIRSARRTLISENLEALLARRRLQTRRSALYVFLWRQFHQVAMAMRPPR